MTSALPIGNGTIGAMVFGGVNQDHIQFNDKTLWTGTTRNLGKEQGLSDKQTRGSYQNFGDVYLDFPEVKAVTNYRRELDLETAVAKTTYTVNGVTYTRTYFTSYPDHAIIVHISASQPGQVSFSTGLVDAHQGRMPKPTVTAQGNKITQQGKLDLINYESQLSVNNEGGTIQTESAKITVTNANAVTLVLSPKTNFSATANNYLAFDAAKLHHQVTETNQQASNKAYTALLNAHTKDYQALFNRVNLQLGESLKPTIPTDELQKTYNEGNYNPYLDVLFYQFGRYLMISSARGVALPSNLQGIWNDSPNPAWEADYHSDVNVQMNYWPSEITNLPEAHSTLTDYLYNEALVQPYWRQDAKEDGQIGWSQWVQNNAFGYGNWRKTRPANAWYCMDMWQHYTFNLDKKYLSEKAYPVMKGACEYWLGRLVEQDGKWIAPAEWSPENGGANSDKGIAYAQQLIWDLFTNTINATKILKTDKEFSKALQTKLDDLDNGLKIGKRGQLMEWNDETIEENRLKKEPTHRHLSHLMGLYPGKQISPLIDEKYADAAKKSLDIRGDHSTGWALAWRMACWARLFDGNRAHNMLKNGLINITATEITYSEAGVYQNLLNGPPFQIDGNFGFTAAMTEMLLQSQLDKIQLLPALPAAWNKGCVNGLRAKGNFTVDINWEKGKKASATILSVSGNKCAVYYPGIKNAVITNHAGKNVAFKLEDNNTIAFKTRKGELYHITNLDLN